MYKKNYLSREEYGIWRYIKDNEIIDSELIKQIFPEMPENKKNKILHSLYKKGYINRARKDLYYNPVKLKNFYKLALRVKEGYIGLGSALRCYNLLEYEDFTIFVITKNFRKKIALKGTAYEIQYIPLEKFFCGFGKRDDLHISSIEKTFFDCFLKPRFIGFTDVTKTLYGAKIDWDKFLSFFKLTHNNSLCQRTGYVLELMKKNTGSKIPSFVFEYLLKSIKNPVKLMPLKGKSTFNRKWKVQDNIGKENILSWWH
ncbi:hypothetical protein HYS31_08205 [Candidatus Woesearchaeota archaeon]|nr:hypothetical protein [Candidatus Woesearchaeota archaeon]